MAHTVSDTTIDGFPVVLLAAPAAGVEAAFAPGVGMVCCSLRHDGAELLGQRGGLAAYAERGSSFGIPLLHPWANRLAEPRYPAGRSAGAAGRSAGAAARGGGAGGELVELDFERMPLRRDENGLPIHGVLAGSRDWHEAERGADAGGAWLAAELDFGARPELLAAFPFPHVLRLEVRLVGAPVAGAPDGAGATLTVRLWLRATGVVPVPVSFGFHPYLKLPGVPRAEWQVSLPVRRRALLDPRGIPTGETEEPPFTAGTLGERAFDDLFPALAPDPRFGLEGGGRRLAVELLDGYPVAQVYSPAGADFICFEPMTAPTNALRSGDGLRWVPPGGRFSATFAVTIEESQAGWARRA